MEGVGEKRKCASYSDGKRSTNFKKYKFAQGSQLDDDTYYYFRRINKIKFADFQTQEEVDVFANNVFTQIEGQELKCSSHKLSSRVIEKLIPLVEDEVLKKFTSSLSQDLRPACTDPVASYVVQALVINVNERAYPANNSTEKTIKSSESELQTWFRDWMLQICTFVKNNLEEFVWNRYSNHIIRTCLECLSGISSLSTGNQNNSSQKIATSNVLEKNKKRSTIPPSNISMVKEYAKTIIHWPQLTDMIHETLTSGLLQTLLYAISACSKKKCKMCIEKLLDKCFKPEFGKKEKMLDENGLPSVFFSEAAMRLMETAIKVSPTELLHTHFLVDIFQDRLTALSTHPNANHAVQQLFAHIMDPLLFQDMFDELNDYEIILAYGNSGVIVSLAQTCVRFGIRQSTFLKQLTNALHCSDENQNKLAHLILGLIKKEDWEGQIRVQHNGSVLMQTLLKFKKPMKIINSLMEMSAAELKSVFCDPKGSYVMDAYMTSEYVGEKSRERMIRKLQGTYVALACSKFGSRVLDAIWSVATMKHKLFIMDELAPSGAILQNNQFGSIIHGKYGIPIYTRRVATWKDAQSKENRKRALFAPIIGVA